MVDAQAGLAKQEKISDVMIGHFGCSSNAWKPLQSLDDCNYNVTKIDDYPKLLSLLILAHGLKRYPENFRKLAPAVFIWQMFRSPLLSIKTQLSMLSHACHSRGAQHLLACCNLLVPDHVNSKSFREFSQIHVSVFLYQTAEVSDNWRRYHDLRDTISVHTVNN